MLAKDQNWTTVKIKTMKYLKTDEADRGASALPGRHMVEDGLKIIKGPLALERSRAGTGGETRKHYFFLT